MAHIYISAARKSSGKTSVSIGLCAALARRGLKVQPFKKGPDYIDPLWLTRAAGRPCYNLDFFTQTKPEILATFDAGMATADIGLIEGNKGLFDGLDVEGTDSNAALATILSAPVVLVIDTCGITRGIAPLVRGYLDFEPGVEICGVILNKVSSARHETKLRSALERYTDANVLGIIGRDTDLEIPERHLGLVPANESDAADTMILRLADSVEAGVELDQIIEKGGQGHKKGSQSTKKRDQNAEKEGQSNKMGDKGPNIDSQSSNNVDQSPFSRNKGPDPSFLRIAVARDAAFGFYYPDDLEAFAAAGAELVPFDTLSDSHLPEVDGLFIGGGFPETHLATMAANQGLLADIRRVLAAGLPAYAECGGLMYLARRIRWRGESQAMVGAVPADVSVGDKPQGRGYVRLEETGNSPWPPSTTADHCKTREIGAHEFHYAKLENLGAKSRFAHRVLRGTGIDGTHDGLIIGNLVAGFVHHRNTRANPWVERFVAFVRSKGGRG